MHYTIEKIAGIDCIFAPMSDSNSVTIEILTKAGSIYESRDTNGISHFLEHMFFKGGKKYPTPKAVAEAVDSFGGEFNAYTGDDYAGYYVKSAPMFVHESIDVLADMMINPQFPKDELEREKGVVIQEIMMYEDRPVSLVLDKWKNYYYGDNSYGWSTLGPVDNIKSFTQDHLFTHKQRLYTKDNLIIIIAGKITDIQAVKDQINTLFATLPESKSYDKPKYELHTPTDKVAWYDKKTQQNHLVIAARGFDGWSDDKYAAKVVATILGGNMSSRLFQNIREKQGLCYYIRGEHHAEVDDGVFMVRAGIDKERFDFGVEKIRTEIADIAAGNIRDEEFDKAISGVIGSLQMGIETSDQMTSFLGMQYLLYGEVISMEEKIAKYQKVNLEQVKLAAKQLSQDKLSMYYIR